MTSQLLHIVQIINRRNQVCRVHDPLVRILKSEEEILVAVQVVVVIVQVVVVEVLVVVVQVAEVDGVEAQ